MAKPFTTLGFFECMGLMILGAALMTAIEAGASLRPLSANHAIPNAPLAGNSPSAPSGGGGTNVAAPTQAQVDETVARSTSSLREEIKTSEEQHRAVLDKLIVLVGGYSLLIGLTAFFSLKSAREEAQSQIGLSGTQLTNHLKSTTDQLELLQDQAKAQLEQSKEEINELKEHIWSDVPDMRAMQEGLRSLLFELHTIIPSETDWNDESAYKALREEEKQEILISEITIAALPALISRQSPQNVTSLARLYRALARFYFARYKAEGKRIDSARAHAYLNRSLHLDREDAASYGLRGAIFLAEQRLSPPGSGASALLLTEAKTNLRIAIGKSANDLGAHYNLALALTRGNQPNELDEAIELVRGILGRLTSFSDVQRRKYLGALAVNQACDLLTRSRRETDAAKRASFEEEAVNTILEGMTALRPDRERAAIEAFYMLLEKELKPGGDLDGLDPARKQELRKELSGGQP